MALAMAAGSLGSARTAAPPAVSGMALVSEVTTGQPQAMASRMGSPKVSLRRRVHEHVGRLVETDGLFERDSADEDHVSGDTELGRERVQRGHVFLVPPGANDRQLAVPELTTGQRPRPQQPVAVLVRPQRRHEEHERLRHAVRRDHVRPGRAGIARLEQVVVDRFIDQLELARDRLPGSAGSRSAGSRS